MSFYNFLKEICFRKKIRVCFCVMYTDIFPGQTVFEKMLKDKRFDPFIFVIPDICNQKGEKEFTTIENTYNFFKKNYKNVKKSIDANKNYIDIKNKIDIICVPVLYEGMTHNFYRTSYLKDKIFIYFSYGYIISKWGNSEIAKYISKINCFFSETTANAIAIKKLCNDKDSKKVVCLGYPKMDIFPKNIVKVNHRKRIIIAFHHTIENKEGFLRLSNFLRFSKFFLTVPKRYKDIDFIFRPHVLLFAKIERLGIWSKDRIDKYINDLKKESNLVWETPSDTKITFNSFTNSDGLIHDCGSFMAEYLFSGNPACYMINEHTRQDLNGFGNKCVDRHYQAFNEQDIINFIDNVILKGEDPMKEERMSFVNKELKINYPNSAEAICKYIKKELI